MSVETVFIGFGSNLGDRHELCDRALALMRLLPHSQFIEASSYYETEPIDPDGTLGATWFYNGVVQVETRLSPQHLLTILQETERGLGRNGDRNGGPRPMDFDLLFYGQATISQPELTIPHPRLHLRRFVLEPLVELDPEWNHPLLQKSMKELLDQVPDTSQVRKLALTPGSRYRSPTTCSPSTS